jgi:hypothetical protein
MRGVQFLGGKDCLESCLEHTTQTIYEQKHVMFACLQLGCSLVDNKKANIRYRKQQNVDEMQFSKSKMNVRISGTANLK